MKKWWLFGALTMLFGMHTIAQQIVFSSLKDLIAGRGDTLTTLKVEKRSKNQIYLSGGADYRISTNDNPGLCKYLKSRCYAVKIDTALYINCKKVRYKKFRFGNWYAPAMWVKQKIYFCAQPLGSVAAASAVTSDDATKLGGDVGTAIASSGLVNARVFYELDPSTGKVDFVGKEKMISLLGSYPELLNNFLLENCETSNITGKYLLLLRK